MVIFGYLGSILVLAFVSFIFFFFKCWLRNPNNGLPWNWPLFGMIPTLLFNLHRFPDRVTEILERSKGTFLLKGVSYCNMDMLFTCDPTNVHHISSTNFWNYCKGPENREFFDFLGNSIFNRDFEEWSHYRRYVHSYVNHKDFHQFLPKIIAAGVTEGLIPVLDHVSKQGQVVNFQDMFKRFVYDIAWMMSTGYNPKSCSIGFPENLFLKAIDDACEAIFSRHLLPGYAWRLQRRLGIGKEKKLSNAQKITNQIASKYISMKREDLSKQSEHKADEEGFDALWCFLTDHEVAGSQSEEFITFSTLGFAFAAYDTSSATLAWFFWRLSKNPTVEAKIREELHNNFSLKGAKSLKTIFSKEELTNLVYLHAALCETLRLHPTAPFNRRNPVKADILPSGHHVTPETKVLLSAYAMGRMTSLWGEDCHEFKPERWINEKGTIKYETTRKFFSFGAGPRICPGKDVAMTVLKTAAATIIYNYFVEVVETHPVIPKASILHEMKHGLRARIRSRWAD
ncbi:cytochrome P450 family protein [Tripterygium wilfordii]|uniref:Cytochrome P450 family protein n=1 Tax=Tripterygium wilfordii TaxID=458696 RepID=A0A7J7DFX0_TRIWF|nr:alkane hydroxylase MAH1-like [Tripterygium wilfordii]KAF5745232.1 cytochrome P450 family protein [Tripterygium wilfordii]